jgi:hypothetical protein
VLADRQCRLRGARGILKSEDGASREAPLLRNIRASRSITFKLRDPGATRRRTENPA